ncbi:MAG: glycosyltransferase [Lachnospiraceae bacterium]|nr:glycosyltransferase [Lachnospiraceae bacterium]
MFQISIITPCYNVEAYIDRCIESLVCQTIGIENLQLICIDDASTDSTYDKLLAWEAKYPDNIIVIHCDTNKRQGAARNLALEYVDSAYITYVDSDDWLDISCLKIMYNVADKTGAQMVTCGHIRDFGKQTTPLTSNNSDIPYREIRINNKEMRAEQIRFASAAPQVWGRLIKKDFIIENDLFFPEEVTYEDNLWCGILSCKIEHYCKLEIPLYHYFVNDNSTILTSDSLHHIDFLTVQLLKWDYMVSNGYHEEYRDAVEFDFLHNCYLDFLKLICLRYSKPQYSLFRLLQETVQVRISKIENNKYYEQGFTEFQKLLLGFIYMNVTKEDFADMTLLIRKNGI